jgi:hypothetical protein
MKQELIKRITNYLGIPVEENKATDKEISEAEKKLKIKFNEDYKEFIKLFGGCYVGVCIYAFKNSDELENKTVVDLTLFYREQKWPGTEDNYVVSFDLSGNPITIKTSGEVVVFEHNIGSFFKLADSFEDLINDNLPD